MLRRSLFLIQPTQLTTRDVEFYNLDIFAKKISSTLIEEKNWANLQNLFCMVLKYPFRLHWDNPQERAFTDKSPLIVALSGPLRTLILVCMCVFYFKKNSKHANAIQCLSESVCTENGNDLQPRNI